VRLRGFFFVASIPGVRVATLLLPGVGLFGTLLRVLGGWFGLFACWACLKVVLHSFLPLGVRVPIRAFAFSIPLQVGTFLNSVIHSLP
jgi:hypothetical protein